MDFSISSLFAGFVFGVFGFYLLKEARRRGHLPWVLIGVAMIAYPYFVAGAASTWAIGAGLMAAAYVLRNRGL